MTRNGPAIRILDRVLAVDVVVFRRISDTATRTVMNTASADKKLGKRSWKAQFLALNESQPLLSPKGQSALHKGVERPAHTRSLGCGALMSGCSNGLLAIIRPTYA